jgi:hypothetical protein
MGHGTAIISSESEPALNPSEASGRAFASSALAIDLHSLDSLFTIGGPLVSLNKRWNSRRNGASGSDFESFSFAGTSGRAVVLDVAERTAASRAVGLRPLLADHHLFSIMVGRFP